MTSEKINEPHTNHDHNHRHPLLRWCLWVWMRRARSVSCLARNARSEGRDKKDLCKD